MTELSLLLQTELGHCDWRSPDKPYHVLSVSLFYWDPALDFGPYLTKSSDSKLFKISEQLSAADSVYTEGVF